MWRYHKLKMGCGKIIFGLLLVFVCQIFLTTIFDSSPAYASTPTTITIEVAGDINVDVVPNQFKSGSTTFTVTTDSPNGYKVLMETGGTSTDLIPESGGDTTIPTIILPTGKSFISASEVNKAHAYSMDNTKFRPIPAIGNSDTIVEVNEVNGTVANTHTITMGVKVENDIPPGKYTNSLILTAIANTPDICDPNLICYNKNGSEEGAEAIEQSVTSNTNATLSSPNFYRTGYGFTGWNTRRDGTGDTYGPNQTIPVGDVSNEGIMLYAKWLESEDTLQNWDGCDVMGIGDTIALTDSRDGNVYTVAKLADHACWMTENLRLDLSNPDVTITAANTNNPAPDFMVAVNQHPSSSSNFCTTNNASCVNRILFNANGVNPNSADLWYSYGVYYNWYTATAGNGTYSMTDPKTKVAGDICPAGWSLPDGYSINGDYATLDIALGGRGSNETSSLMSNRWRSYPNNFLFSGQQNGNSITNRGETGNYHGISASSSNNLINMWLQATKVSTNTNGSSKIRGQSVRCMMQKYYTVHFDANTTAEVDGIMYDQRTAVGNSIKIDSNNFTISPQGGHVYKFINWNTAADGSGDSYADGATITNLGATAGQTVTLYAQWEVLSLVDVTVVFPQGITEIRLSNSDYDSYYSVTESGDVVNLVGTKPYTISAVLDSSYDFDGWATTAGGTLGSTVVSPTTYTVTSAATLTASATYRTTTLYLQNLSSTSCSSTPRTVFDNRDNEAYTIARLDDGNCWMLDDLRLGSTTLLAPITDANTNMPENSSPLILTQPTRLHDYETPEIDLSRVGQSVTNYGSGSGKAGVYYNFCAASAGTVCSASSPQNAIYDICPVGWRLATGGSSGELQALYRTYGSNVSRFNAAFSTALSGWFDANQGNNGTYKEFDSAVVYWSSTASNNINKTYILKLTRNSIVQNTGYLENNGFSVRCLLKSE